MKEMTELKMVYELVISRVNLLDKGYQHNQKNIYREETLQELCLGLHSMCVGTESKYFNGHTNIIDDTFLCFGVKGLMDTNRRLKDAMLFNVLSYMTNELLGKGNTVAAIDELYLFLTNMTAIEYIRNASKRVRKKESSVILASQNIDDFLIEGVKEYTKPLFSIPTHQFLFNAGSVKPKVIWMYCKLKSLNLREFVIPNEELVYSAVVMSDTYFKLSHLSSNRKCLERLAEGKIIVDILL